MYEAWANTGLLLMALIIGGIAWFILYIFGVAVFEDFLGGIANKAKRKRDEDDFYIY
jgi:hypothetical protein